MAIRMYGLACHPSRRRCAVRYLLAPALLVAVACDQPPTQPLEPAAPGILTKGGPPSSCNAFAPLSATLRDQAGDALQSDGGGGYVEGQNGVEAHVNDPTGNLSIWTTESPRRLVLTTPGGGTVDIDRAYTNTHSNACGLRLSTLPASSSAVFEGEERAGGSGGSVSIVRYGKSCASGTPTGSMVTIVKVGATSATITGSSGVYCTKNKNKWVHAGVVGPFEMTLEYAP
jgi:hypothetical protein